jgi:hydroxymethylpyrimidine pyrophosphatase-like HAD family hydrolase
MFVQADEKKDVVFTEGLTAAATAQVLDICSKLDLCISYSEPLGATAAPQNSNHEELLRKFEELEGVTQERVASCAPLLAANRLPLKVVALTENPEDSAAQARALLPDNAAHVIAAEMHIEFLHPTVSKGKTLEKFCGDTFDMKMEDVVAFGDNHNDVDMLRLAGRGVAMQNAKDSVKEIADQVCEWSNDDEGVARTLEHLLDAGSLSRL